MSASPPTVLVAERDQRSRSAALRSLPRARYVPETGLPRVLLGGPAHGPRTLVLLPAHDEEDRIGAALRSLHAQTRTPTWIVVVTDNCTDRTADVARAHGATVFRTVGNTRKKAGALNQALSRYLPELRAEDHVLVMDADSVLVPEFLEHAARHLESGDGAVGGIFHGEPGGGLVGALQRNEYTRYAREIQRRRGELSVLTGTASAFRVATLRDVSGARQDGRLPAGDGRGGVYETTALTEDNEITLAVKTLGWPTRSPAGCRVVTEIMPSWPDLWRQRLRWQRGALDNLRHYGWTRVTLPYILKQAAMYLGIVAIALFLTTTALFLALGVYGPPHGFWLLITAIFVVERVVTVRRGGWRAVALAAPLLVEFGYDLFQQAVFLRAAADAVFGRATEWHHLAKGQ